MAEARMAWAGEQLARLLEVFQKMQGPPAGSLESGGWATLETTASLLFEEGRWEEFEGVLRSYGILKPWELWRGPLPAGSEEEVMEWNDLHPGWRDQIFTAAP
jgi:hypothetical protein